MRFPMRLTTELGVSLAVKVFVRDANQSLVVSVDPVELPGDSSGPLKSEAAAVWISGSEPLLQPEIARVTRELLRAGRYVFLRTDGQLWRRRVHEFQPVPQFFLTVNCNRAGDTRAKEAIRIARLSGFLTCVHTEIASTTDAASLQDLRDYVGAAHADGWVIAASASVGAVEYSVVHRKAAEARTFIPSRRWRIFSQFVEAAIHARKEPAARAHETLVASPTADACEESAGAQ